ncbi:MAG: lysine biosynthesis protein LysX [Nitrososphaerota archaeon]|nr:lysine biosynthesis protein LysX [Nitrososphaerota archaeon]
MRLGIAYDRLRYEEKELFNAAQKSGYNPVMVYLGELTVDLTEGQRKLKETASVVLQRCVSHVRGLHVAAAFENVGVKTVNSYKVSSLCGDKMLTSLALAKAKVPTPRTLVTFSPEQTLNALDALGYPAVIKPVVGSWGRLVTRVRDREEAMSQIEAREAAGDSMNQVYYVQEFIKRPERDLRVIVAGDEIVASIYRYQPGGDWRTNVARGGRAETAKLSGGEMETIIRAAHAVGGGVLGVDAMEGPDGLVVHEVNGTVEFRGAASVSDTNIPNKIVQYAASLVKR